MATQHGVNIAEMASFHSHHAERVVLSDFAVTGSSTGQGTLELASAAPEPSTWALMFGGLGVLVLIQRRRSLKA
jgi:hypothetical protein